MPALWAANDVPIFAKIGFAGAHLVERYLSCGLGSVGLLRSGLSEADLDFRAFVYCTWATSSAVQRYSTGRRWRDLAEMTPLAVLTPRNVPTAHLVPMLPSCAARGPLVGSL